MFNFPNPTLSEGPISTLLRIRGITTFHDAVYWVWKLPYGRNSDRSDFTLVPVEKKGACSTKHACLAAISRENDISLTLTVGIFMMNAENTPSVGPILLKAGLTEIPEAHCYLRFGDFRYDVTSFRESSSPMLALDIVHEESIAPEQIGDHKINLHRAWMEQWRSESTPELSLDQLWHIRESCIFLLT